MEGELIDADKTSQEVSLWLADKGIPVDVCDVFEGM